MEVREAKLWIKEKIDELAALELRQTKELLAYTRDTSQQRIESLEQQAQKLFVLIADGIQSRKEGHEILKELVARFDKSSAIHQALQMLAEKLEHGVSLTDQDLVRKALEVIHKERPSLLLELLSLLQGTVSGVTGNAVYSWILAFINSLPK